MQQSKMKQIFAHKWSVGVLAAIASAMLLAGAISLAQATAADAGPQVIIDNYAFSPASLTVKVGTTVTWINQDDDAHTVDSTQGKFESGTMNKGGRFEFRFTEAGEYPFFCRFHPKMTGKVIVQQ